MGLAHSGVEFRTLGATIASFPPHSDHRDECQEEGGEGYGENRGGETNLVDLSEGKVPEADKG